jgi:hypothetical protein
MRSSSGVFTESFNRASQAVWHGHRLGWRVSERRLRLSHEGSRTSKGMAVLESALWIVVSLPLMLKGLSLIAILHDQNVLQGVPQASLREIFTEGMRWEPTSRGDQYLVSVENLRDALVTLTQSSLRESMDGVFKATGVSSKACFWVYSVNKFSGVLEGQLAAECDARGPGATNLSLVRYIEEETARHRGIGSRNGANGNIYLEKVVLIGLAVGAEIDDPLSGLPFHLEAGAISIPRQEIVL